MYIYMCLSLLADGGCSYLYGKPTLLVLSLLLCTVHECRNLPPMDANGLADPYVKLRLYPEPTDAPNAKQKTERKEKTLEPKFEEEFF